MNKCTLGDLIEFQRGYDLPKSKTKNGKYKVVTSNGVLAHHNEFKSDPSVVIGRSGTVGNPQIIKEKFWPHNTTLFIKDLKGNDLDYIYYLLLNLNIGKMKSGSNIPTLNRNHLHPIEINAEEDVDKQKRISRILATIDSKIEYNNKINQKYEELARKIYDYWFLQFDFPDEDGKPYKESGGKLIWNEELKKEIPEKWEVKKLSELLKKNNKSFNYEKNVDTIDLSVMPSNSISLNQLNESKNFSTNLFEMKCGDILFGSIRPYLHKAGIAPVDGAVAGTVFSYNPIYEYDYNFTLITLSSKNCFNYAVSSSTGTKMPVIKNDILLNYKVAYNKEVVEKYNSYLNLKELLTFNIQENQRLIELRDFLLPLLINGQVKI